MTNKNWLFHYLLLAYFSLSYITCSLAQTAFEGVLDFNMQNKTAQVNYTYSIKGDKIKIDQFNVKTQQLETSFIIDLSNEHVVCINHDQKKWAEQTATVKASPPGKTDILKTTNTKVLLGYTCTEYIVKNKVDGVSISYWIGPFAFNFFDKLAEVMNSHEKFLMYYLKMPDIKGMLPFLAIISPVTKMEKTCWQLTKFEVKKIDAAIFTIPSDYLKQEN